MSEDATMAAFFFSYFKSATCSTCSVYLQAGVVLLLQLSVLQHRTDATALTIPKLAEIF